MFFIIGFFVTGVYAIIGVAFYRAQKYNGFDEYGDGVYLDDIAFVSSIFWPVAILIPKIAIKVASTFLWIANVPIEFLAKYFQKIV